MTLEDFDDEEPTFPAHQHRPRILVAEDDGNLRRLIGTRLRRDYFDVVEACSGTDALKILQMISRHGWPLENLDLIIMDVRMPGPSGLELTQRLRGDRWTTPILLMTAYPDPGLLAETDKLGVAVLAKPFELDALTDAAIDALVRAPS